MSDNEFHQELRFKERVNGSLGLSGLLESALINIFESVVPFTEVLCFEGTIGVTVDRKKTLLLHFSNAVSKNVSVTVCKEECNNEEPEDKSNESCFQSIMKDNFPHLQEKQQKTDTNDLKQSLLRMFLRGKKTFYSGEEITMPSQKDCYWDVHREGHVSQSRRGRPPRYLLEKPATPVIGTLSRHQITDRSTTEVDQESTQGQNVGKFYVNIEPDGCRGDMDISALEESEHCSKGKDGVLSTQSQENDEKQDGHSRTLLRQLLQLEKPVKSKPRKRKFIDSEECLLPSGEDPFPATLLNGTGHSLHSSGGDVLLKQEESLNLSGISSLRSGSSKIDPVAPRSKPVEDDVTYGNRTSDSILCRLLTSSVSMYNTTEVDQVRKTPHCSPNHPVSNRVEGFCNDGFGPSEALADDEAAVVNFEKSICNREESNVSIKNPSSASLQSVLREVLMAQNDVNVDRITSKMQHSSSVSSAPDFSLIKTEPGDFRECSTVNLSSDSSIQWEDI